MKVEFDSFRRRTSYVQYALVILVISLNLMDEVRCAGLDTSATGRLGRNKTTALKRTGSKRLMKRDGQLESFNLDSFGLGDMQATDSKLTIGKRSLVGLIPGSSSSSLEESQTGAGLRRKRIPARKISQPIVFRNPVRDQQHLSRAYILDRWPRRDYRIHSRLGDELVDPLQWDNDGQLGDGEQESPAESRVFGSRSKGLSAFVRKNRQLGPIIISHRAAEELLDAPAPLEDSADTLETADLESKHVKQSLSEEHNESADFPLLGEFGSRVSLLTTRKTQPTDRRYSFSNPSYMPSLATTVGGGHVTEDLLGPWPITEDLLEDAEPVSSSAQILSRSLLNQVRKQRKGAIGIGEEINGVGIDEDESASGQTDATDAVLEINTNYLPRIARNSLM